MNGDRKISLLVRSSFALGLFWTSSVFADTVGILGGPLSIAPAYAGFVTPGSSAVQTLNLTGKNTTFGAVVNASGEGFLGGGTSPNGWAYFTNKGSLALEAVTAPFSIDSVYCVSLNELGQALFGGSSLLAFVNQDNLQAQFIPGGYDNVFTVSLNNKGQGLIGGNLNYAAFVGVNSSSCQQITTTSFSGYIPSVALNDLGQGLIGWSSGQAAFVTYGEISPQAIQLDPAVSQINSVALNQGGEGLIGGVLGLSPPQSGYAAFVSFGNPSPQPINLGSLTGNLITGVAINDLGQGLVVGDGGYAAFVTAGSANAQVIPLGTTNNLLRAAINNFGQGLIGGNQYAAFVDANYPNLPPVVISLPGGMLIDSVSLSSVIPLQSANGTLLKQNNLKFAEYINNKAPQKAFYFLPSVWHNSLAEALQNAAPTRNAISIYSADQNFFYLNHGLSNHLRNYRHFKQQEKKDVLDKKPFLVEADIPMQIYDAETGKYRSLPSKGPVKTCPNLPKKERTATVWFEALGALAAQKSQHQTPAFYPSMAGGILAFDGTLYQNTQLGFGIAYTFTDIDEEHNLGSGHIHQEYVFAYTSWSKNNYYLDTAIWGAMFQTYQTRKIDLLGWNFTSHSKPTGWQVCPHLEFGYDTLNWAFLDCGFLVNPFAMFDWANNGQKSYEETGNSPFNAGQDFHYSSLLRSELGIRFYEPIVFDICKILLEQKVSYVNKAPFHIGQMTAFLVGSPGNFTMETLSSNQNLVAVEAYLVFDPLNPTYPYWSLTYQGEFGSSFNSNQLLFELSWEL